jgi:hypothetical protein
MRKWEGETAGQRRTVVRRWRINGEDLIHGNGKGWRGSDTKHLENLTYRFEHLQKQWCYPMNLTKEMFGFKTGEKI